MDVATAMQMALQQAAAQRQASQQAYANYQMAQLDGQQRAAVQMNAAYQMQNMYLISDPAHELDEAERRQAEHDVLMRRRKEIFGEDLSDVMAETDRLATKWL